MSEHFNVQQQRNSKQSLCYCEFCVNICAVLLQFLSFFFTNLTTWIQEEWSSIYDAAYVEEQWIGPLLRLKKLESFSDFI